LRYISSSVPWKQRVCLLSGVHQAIKYIPVSFIPTNKTSKTKNNTEPGNGKKKEKGHKAMDH
jgi:hypothetical protein